MMENLHSNWGWWEVYVFLGMTGFLGSIRAETDKVLSEPGHLARPTSVLGLPLLSRSCHGLGSLAPIPKALNHHGMVSGNVCTHYPVCVVIVSQISDSDWPRKAKPQTKLSQPDCCFRSDELKCPRGQVWSSWSSRQVILSTHRGKGAGEQLLETQTQPRNLQKRGFRFLLSSFGE